MNLYTSNFARNGKNPMAVSISIRPIWWYKGRQYPLLAPTWDIVMGLKMREITEKEYTQQYLEIINGRKIDPQKLLNDLGDGAVMLCYESPNAFCHRHIIGQWITERTGVEVVELLDNTPPNKQVDDLFEF